MRAAPVLASIVALTLLGGAAVGWAQGIPRLPGIPSIPGIPGIPQSDQSRSTLQPFTGELKTLTGSVPTLTSLRGVYSMTSQESRITIDNFTVRDFTSVATLRLSKNGTYELAYQASWGPGRLNGIEVNEQGRFSLSSAVVLLEPERITQTRTKNGVEGPQQTQNAPRRSYVARVAIQVQGMKSTTRSLTLVGRCPPYQLDSACQYGMTVQYLFLPEVATVRRR